MNITVLTAQQRARKIVLPTGGIVRGKFPSRKNGRMVHHEGLLELDAIYLFEASSLIEKYRKQPETICYPDDTRIRRYTPDFELTLATGELVFIEVKPRRGLCDPEVRHKLDQVAQYLQRSEKSFVILDDETLRNEPRQSNVRAIYHGAPRVSECKIRNIHRRDLLHAAPDRRRRAQRCDNGRM